MKFVVDRQTWYRGRGIENSRLLTSDGQRCCIGFVANQCRIPDSQILDKPTLHSIYIQGEEYNPECLKNTPAWMTDIVQLNGKTASTASTASTDLMRAYIANDRQDISDADREAQLKTIFAAHGDEIEFIN